jgi:hypothetical protein
MYAQERMQLPAQDNANKIESIIHAAESFISWTSDKNEISTACQHTNTTAWHAGWLGIQDWCFLFNNVNAANDYIAFDLINKAIPE